MSTLIKLLIFSLFTLHVLGHSFISGIGDANGTAAVGFGVTDPKKFNRKEVNLVFTRKLGQSDRTNSRL